MSFAVVVNPSTGFGVALPVLFPIFTLDPVDQSVALSATATFTATAVNGTITYQWQRINP